LSSWTGIYTVAIDFRMIPLGDIDLRKEIRLDDETGVVDRRLRRRSGRQMYTARIGRRRSDMTVVLYHGDEAEKVGSLFTC
jgi:hypothetical protein